MNIHDVATKSGVSVRALRKLEKLKLIAFDPEPDSDEHPRAAEARFLLMRNQQMPATLLVEFLENPSALYDLRKYEARARAQMAELGDVAGQMAPIAVQAVISDAAGADPAAVDTLADWLRSILPAAPVSHHWIATRLLLPLDPIQRDSMAKKINFAMNYVRRLESFRAYWASVKPPRGKVNVIKYFRPAVDSFDL